MKNVEALDQKKFPSEYKEYFLNEAILVRKIIYGDVLDVGCGQVRVLQYIHNKCRSYTGIDVDPETIEKQKELVKQYPNAKLMVADATRLQDYFQGNQFDVSFCLWNTIHLIGDEKKVLQDIAEVTKAKILVTLVAKNVLSLAARKNYYKTFGIEHTVDEKTQTITSNVWGESKAYRLSDLERWSKESNLPLIESGEIGYMGIYGIFSKKQH